MTGRNPYVIVCLGIAILCSVPAISVADDERSRTVRATVAIGWRADGTATNAILVDSGDDRTYSSAVPIRSAHWTTHYRNINFDSTPDATGRSSSIRKVMTKYLNKRFGNANAPRFNVTTVQVPVKSLASFGNNLTSFRRQFDFDNHNEIVMTQDDQFFKDLTGQLENPALVAWTHLFLSAAIDFQNERWVGAFTIVEADVWLRSDFFSLPAIKQQTLLSGSFRAALGYEKTAWIYDFHADVNVVSSAMFRNNKSPAWALARELDNMFYTDPVTILGSAAYLSTPRVLPLDNAVIDLKNYKLPATDPYTPLPLLNVPALFLTNLKGFESGKEVSAAFAITPPGSPAAKKVKILTINGPAYEYPWSFMLDGKLTPWYPRITLNYLLMGRAEDLAKLRDSINLYGAPLQVEGASFNKALKCDVTISGYLDEKGARKKVVRKLYITDSSL